MYKALQICVGKLKRPAIETATAANGPLVRLITVHDPLTNLQFLVDTGAQLSIVPPTAFPQSALKLAVSPGLVLKAANGTPIKTYGEKSLTLSLGLKRAFR